MKRRLLLSMVSTLALSACSSKFKLYNGPRVTRVIVFKGQRKMHLTHNDKALRNYDVGLGFATFHHKREEGDGRTPEGHYLIDRRNPSSKFHLSLDINHPNAQDVAKARAAGVSPGGDIFIHGRPPLYAKGGRDWTAGCIAITEKKMEVIYSMVENGTPISIFP